MSKVKKYEGLPGFDIDPVTGRYFPVPLNMKEFLRAANGGSPRQTPKKRGSSKKTDSRSENEAILDPKRKYEGLPGFDIDPVTGRYFPVPLNMKEFLRAANGESPRQTPKKAIVGIDSISTKRKPQNSCNKITSQPIQTGVRKELFTIGSGSKLPVNKHRSSIARSTRNRYSTTSSLSQNNCLKGAVKKRFSRKIDLPSINLTQAHTELAQALPQTPQLNVSVALQPKDVKLEKPKMHLFETKITSDKETNEVKVHKNQPEIIKEIKNIVKLNQELFEESSKKCNELFEMHRRHGENLRKMLTLVSELDDMDKNGENSLKRRSLRLKNKSPSKKLKTLDGSQYVCENGDLDKSTLTKVATNKENTLVKKYELSPRFAATKTSLTITRPVTSPSSRIVQLTKPTILETEPFRRKSFTSKQASEQLLAIQEEPEQNDDNLIFKLPVTPELKVLENITKNDEEFKTPDSNKEMEEFLRNEQLFKTPKEPPLFTPVSLVCKLFKSMDVEEEEESKENDNIVKTNEQSPKKSFKTINQNDDNTVKLSPKRRSLRLQKQNINNTLGSPVILKSGDLRKSALTKSLAKKYQEDSSKSPRTQRAFDLYMSMKKQYSSLMLTPKFSKNQLSNNNYGNSARKLISTKLQQQCLMLQDTP